MVFSIKPIKNLYKFNGHNLDIINHIQPVNLTYIHLLHILARENKGKI